MIYADLTALVARYGMDTILVAGDHDQDGQIDAGAIEQATADASAEIDSYVGALHRLPLTSAPEVLVRLCCDIALYRLSADAGSGTGEKRKRFGCLL